MKENYETMGIVEACPNYATYSIIYLTLSLI